RVQRKLRAGIQQHGYGVLLGISYNEVSSAIAIQVCGGDAGRSRTARERKRCLKSRVTVIDPHENAASPFRNDIRNSVTVEVGQQRQRPIRHPDRFRWLESAVAVPESSRKESVAVEDTSRKCGNISLAILI